MRYPDAFNFKGAIYRRGGVTGPLAPPGTYRVRLTVGEQRWEQTCEIRKDPRVDVGDAELHEQFAFLIEIRDKLGAVNKATVRLRELRGQLELWEGRAKDRAGVEELLAAIQTLKDGLKEVEEELLQTSWKSSRDALTAPSKLNAKLATLLSVAAEADARPNQQMRAVFAELSGQADAQLARLDALTSEQVGRINELVRQAELPALLV
jgi:hypothetical protein